MESYLWFFFVFCYRCRLSLYKAQYFIPTCTYLSPSRLSDTVHIIHQTFNSSPLDSRFTMRSISILRYCELLETMQSWTFGVAEFTCPRHLFWKPYVKYKLNGFGDSSDKGLAAVAHFRFLYPSEKAKTYLSFALNRKLFLWRGFQFLD